MKLTNIFTNKKKKKTVCIFLFKIYVVKQFIFTRMGFHEIFTEHKPKKNIQNTGTRRVPCKGVNKEISEFIKRRTLLDGFPLQYSVVILFWSSVI